MIDFRKYMPTLCNEPILAKTKYGLRKVELSPLHGFWIYTDCCYPWQQIYCSPYDIYEWEYIDTSKMEKLHFIKSIYKQQLREDGERILASIKPTLFKKLKLIFKK